MPMAMRIALCSDEPYAVHAVIEASGGEIRYFV